MNDFLQYILLSMILTLIILPAFAQQQTETEKDAYIKGITQRADKIVRTLDISDPEKTIRVRDIIVNQYRDLSAIHDTRDAGIHAVKEKEELTNEKRERCVKKVEKQAMARLDKLHQGYLKKLSKELIPEKVEKVKDGMTYGVLPITYRGYLEMIPDLTEVQKKKIMEYLLEARDRAMDAGSSEEKHQWFGKYKGRINNYLSDAGYELKKAGQDWEKRRQASKKK